MDVTKYGISQHEMDVRVYVMYYDVSQHVYFYDTSLHVTFCLYSSPGLRVQCPVCVVHVFIVYYIIK